MQQRWESHSTYVAVIAAFCLVAASLALFHSSWTYPFVLDDVAKVEMNPDLRPSRLSVADLFQNYSQTHAHSRNDPSRPLTFFLYWVCWQLGDGSPVPFHILNGILHGLCAFFVGLLAHQLARRHLQAKHGAFVFLGASVLFLTLPLNSATVIYTYGLSDVLSATLAFAILAMVSRETSLGYGALVVVSTLFVLALGAKQSSVVIPALVLAIRPSQRKAVVVLFLLSFLYVISRLVQFGRIGDLEAHEVYPLWDYFTSQGALYFKYLSLAIWPVGFCLDHAIFPREFSSWQVASGWAAIALLTAASLWWIFQRDGWLWWLGASWIVFFVGLLPTSSIFATTDLFVERRAYLSTAGIVMAAVGLLLMLSRRIPLAAWMAGVLIVVLNGYRSWSRNDVFSKKENLWLEVLQLYPNDTRARLNLSTAYLETRRWSEAKEILEALVTEEPRNFQAWANLGALLHSDLSPFHNPERAWICYQKVLELEPDNLNTLSNAGYLMLMKKDPDQAIALFSRALRISPKSPQYHFGLGQSLEMKGDRSGAIKEFEQALFWDPQFKPAQALLRKLASGSN